MRSADAVGPEVGWEAAVFDLDGVLTLTARIHAASWKVLFDAYLHRHSERTGAPFLPFTEADYRDYVDARPRYDGVRTFLASRGITLPEGEPTDSPERETVSGLGIARTPSSTTSWQGRERPPITRRSDWFVRCGRAALASASRPPVRTPDPFSSGPGLTSSSMWWWTASPASAWASPESRRPTSFWNVSGGWVRLTPREQW